MEVTGESVLSSQLSGGPGFCSAGILPAVPRASRPRWRAHARVRCCAAPAGLAIVFAADPPTHVVGYLVPPLCGSFLLRRDGQRFTDGGRRRPPDCRRDPPFRSGLAAGATVAVRHVTGSGKAPHLTAIFAGPRHLPSAGPHLHMKRPNMLRRISAHVGSF